MFTDAKHRLIVMAAAALLAAAPAIAQDNTAQQPAAETPAEQPAAPAESAAPTDGTAQAEAAAAGDGTDGLGQTYVKDTSGDWQILCVRTQLEADPCRMHQLLKDGSGNPVSTMEVTNLPGQQGAGGLTIVTPLETFLKAPLTMSVDGGPGAKFGFEFCTPRGCVVREAVGPDAIDRFRRGAKATLTIVPNAARDQTVTLNVSLSGFTAGYEIVSELNAAAAAAFQKANAAQGQSGN